MVATTALLSFRGGQFATESPGQFARNQVVNFQRNHLSSIPILTWSCSVEYPLLSANSFLIQFKVFCHSIAAFNGNCLGVIDFVILLKLNKILIADCLQKIIFL